MSAAKPKARPLKTLTRRGHERAGSLGLRADDAVRLAALVRAGFPYGQLAKLQKAIALPWAQLGRLLRIPPRTLTRRQAKGRLRPEESDRVLRVSTLFDLAVELFEGDADGARRWLSAPQRGLGGEVPLELASTEIGARAVETLIGRLEHGVLT
jgi:putative toxin-antitoxin system antitoxin component (TIGR02293 family)